MITQKRVKEALQEAELSQAHLARKVKISPASLSNWFAGRQKLSDATLERIALALGLDVGDTTDEQITDALADEAPEIPRATDEDAVEAEIQTAADAPAYRASDADDLYETDEDAAVQEIMDVLGRSEAPEPIPEIEPEPEPEAETEPEPEPTVEIRAQSPAELIWELTRLPGYTLDGGAMVILLPRDSDIEGFCRNLEALDTMLDRGDIDADAHRTVCESLLARYKEEV